MSRAPTNFSSFSDPNIPLQPTATPTQQFVTPGVKVGNTGSQWLDLARTLSVVEPKLNAIFNQRADAYQNAEQLRAQAEAAKHGSIEAFNAAVKRGDLDENQNPWLVRRTRELLAVDRVNQARLDALKAWDTNADIKNGPDADNPAKVREFFSNQLNGVMNGLDVYSAAAARPVLAQSLNYLSQAHEAYRQQQRPIEAEDAYRRNGSDIMAGVDGPTITAFRAGDPQVIATVTAAKRNFQALQASQLRFSDPVTVRNWTKAILTDTAMDRMSGDVFREFYLNGLTKTDGSPLDNSDAAKAHARDIDRVISERQLQQDRQKDEQLHRQGEAVARSFMGTLRERAAALSKQTGKEVNFWELPPSKEDLATLQKQNPEAPGLLLTAYMQSVSADQQTQSMGDRDATFAQVENKGARFVQGQMKPGEEGDFLQMMLHIRGGDQQFEALQRLKNWGRQNAWGSDTPDGLFEAFDRMAKPTAEHPFDLPFIEGMAKSGRLSQSTAERLVNHYFNQTGLGDKSPAMALLGHYGQQLETMIFDKYTSQDPNGRPEEIRENVQGRAAAAKSQYLEDAMKYMNSPEFRQASFDDQTKQLKTMADNAAKANGGFTSGEQSNYHQKLDADRAAAAKPKVEAAHLEKTEPIIAAAKAPGDPALNLIQDHEIGRAKLVLDSKTPKLDGADVARARPTPINPDDATEDEADKDPYYWLLRNRRFNVPEYRNAHWATWIGYKASSRIDGFRAKVDQEELDNFKAVQANAAAQASYLQTSAFDKRYRSTLERMETMPVVSKQDWLDLKGMHNTLTYLSMLRRVAGWTPEEVRAMGANAWKTHGMFANENDLQTRGPAVMKQLGLSASDTLAFQDAQLALAEKMRHAA